MYEYNGRLRAMATLVAVLSAAARVPRPMAACNAIPAPPTGFESTTGTVLAPFAAPGDPVTIRGRMATFATDPSRNQVTLTFTSPDGSTVSFADAAPGRVAGTACPSDPSPCSDLCPCVEFPFPDLHAPNGGQPTGPVRIDISTDGAVTASIGPLSARGSAEYAGFTSFVALPSFTSFKMLYAGGDVAAASDGGNSLLVPLDFSGIAPDVKEGMLPDVVPIVEAQIPGLQGIGPTDLTSFSPDGRALAVSALPVGTSDHVLGTLDGQKLVLRIAHGLGLAKQNASGRLVISAVTGYAPEDDKRAVGTPVFTNSNSRAIYETKDPSNPHLHTLRTLDLMTPLAQPVPLDTIDTTGNDGATGTVLDCSDFTNVLTPNLHPFEAYRILASDSLVGFVVPRCFRFGNYSAKELLRTGAYDLRQFPPIRLMRNDSDVHPLLVDDDILVYSTPSKDGERLLAHSAGTGTDMDDVITQHPAKSPSPPSQRCRRPRGLCNFSVPITWHGSSNDVTNVDSSSGRVAYVVDEIGAGLDLTGNGSVKDLALFLYDPSATPKHTNLFQAVARPGRLLFNGQWLAAEVPSGHGRKQAVAVFDSNRTNCDPQIICDDGPGPGYLAASKGDTFIACAVASRPLDPGKRPPWDPHFRGHYLLHVFIPEQGSEGSGCKVQGREIHLGLELASPYDVQALDFTQDSTQNSTLVVGVDEPAQCSDVDGDGRLDPPDKQGGPYAAYVFDIATGQLTMAGADPVIPRQPLLELERNFAGQSTLTIVTGENQGGPAGTTLFVGPPEKVTGMPGAACASASECDDKDPCTVDECVNGHCASTWPGGVGGLDCALGRMLATPLCDEPLPPRLASSIKRHVPKAVAMLPPMRCPSRTAATWKPVAHNLKLVGQNIDRTVARREELGLSEECINRLTELYQAAWQALTRARGGR